MAYAPVYDNPLVKLDVTHSNLKLRIPEIKFSLLEPICEIKLSLEKRLGTSSGSMDLQLKDQNGAFSCLMNDDLKPLGFYGPSDGYEIHVIDTDPSSITAQLEDLSQVEKYVMTDEDYDKLPNSYRKFIKNMKQNNPELFQTEGPKIVIDPEHLKEEADKIKVGDRMELKDNQARGEVKYVGKISTLAEGYYVGVQLDEPFGLNDGSHKGVHYFNCPKNYGLFLRPDKINVGDFPEEDLDEIAEI